MLLVVVGVLSIVLAFPRPVYDWVVQPSYVVAATAAVTLVPPLLAAFFGRRALRLLERHPEDPGPGQSSLARGHRLLLLVLAVAHGGLLLATNWPRLVADTPVIGRWPLLPALLTIAPFLFSIVLTWIALYPADCALRQIALEAYLFRGRPVRPVPRLPAYLVNSLRHEVLFILIPMLLIVAARDLIGMYDARLRALTGHEFLADILLGTAALIVAVIAPVILRFVWSTRRLPNGPLRDRLESVCRKLRLRYRELLVWHVGSFSVNAAVMGVIAPLRYILITESLLEQLDDAKVEAVFGHEAGHVKRHHILFFLLFGLISGCAIAVFSARTRQMNPHSVEFQLLATALGLVLLVKWGVLFMWISRRFERQADMFGTRVLVLSGLPCQVPCTVHGTPGHPGPDPRPPRHALCATAALLFSNTLNEVAVLNGMPPEGRSWRHGSIAARSRTLLRLAQDPGASAAAERAVFWIKAAILLAALGGSLWAAWELELWKLAGL